MQSAHTQLWHTYNYPYWAPLTIDPPTMAYEPIMVPEVLTEEYHEGKRWYRGGEGLYPSITTLISETDTEGRHFLDKWRRRVGTEAASQITQQAATHGTKWHNFCEAFLTGQPVGPHITHPKDRYMASAITTMLNAHIKTVLVSEARVVSSEYRVAGRMDVCVELRDGRLAILDFKTGKQPKTGNRMQNYGIQATFYARALTELLNRGNIDTIIIAQLCPQHLTWEESSAQLFEPMLRARVNMFYERLTNR